MNGTVVIIGASGHLTTQRLLPALAETSGSKTLDILAVGRKPMSSEEYRQHLVRPERVREDLWQAFVARVRYAQADHASEEGYSQLSNLMGLGDRMFYLAVPPDATAPVIQALKKANLHAAQDGVFRIVLEKPLGLDEKTSRDIWKSLEEFPEDSVYCVDHFLAKETVANVAAFRFGNALFEPLWNRDYIREIQITVAELDGVAHRLHTYSELGAGRDQLQSHCMQLLALLTMEEPESWTASAFAQAKQEVLEHVQAEASVRAQYAMSDEERDALKGQETYLAARLSINNKRWKGVPVYIRTGKQLAARVTDITVVYRTAASGLFGTAGHQNQLTFRIQPDESIFMSMAVRDPHNTSKLLDARMTFCYHDAFRANGPEAYAQVLDSVLAGDRSISVSRAEILESWRILDSLKLTDQPMQRYLPATWGPEEADTIFVSQESSWIQHESDVCNGVTLMAPPAVQ